jgi:hypothetical protein
LEALGYKTDWNGRLEDAREGGREVAPWKGESFTSVRDDMRADDADRVPDDEILGHVK